MEISRRACTSGISGNKRFPKDELYGITSQLRRAALSVPTNIVEGYSRKGDKELTRFINISLGSLAETKYLLKFAKKRIAKMKGL